MGLCGYCTIVAIAVLVISILSQFLIQQEIESPACTMASSRSVKEAFKAAKHGAFVIGYTGESGKALVQELAKQDLFSRIVLIGRRYMELDTVDGVTFEQHVVDYEKLADHADSFKDLDVGYCCLGTTRGKAGADGFRRVDFDYTLHAAQLAKQQGCRHFNLVSSMGADKNSSMLYPSTKGQVEEAITQLLFPRLSIYRPGVLMCERTESRPVEAVARLLLKPFSKLFPTAFTTPTDVLARAMLNNTVLDEAKPATEVLENKQIFSLEKQCPLE